MTYLLHLALIFTLWLPSDLVKTKVTDNVTMLIPSDFMPMTDDEIADKYLTMQRPMMLYTSSRHTADLGINKNKTRWLAKDLEMMMRFQKSSIMALYDEVEIENEGMKELKDKKFGFFEYTSTVHPEKNLVVKKSSIQKYIYIQYTIYEGYLFIFNFSCPVNEKRQYQATVRRIMDNIDLKGKVK